MWDKSNCSVIYTLFKITFLGKWDECAERPFLRPLTSFPDRHIFCAFCPVPSLLLFWTVLLGPHQDLWLCDLLSDGWHEQPLNKVVEGIAPNILLQFLFLLNHGTSLHNTLSTCLQFVQLQPNFHQSLTGYIADMAGTMKSLIWLSGRAAWKLLLSSLLPIPCICLPAAAVYPLWAFSVPQPSVLNIGSYPCLVLLSFPWLLWKSHQISIFASPLRPDGNHRFSGHFQQDCLGTFPEIFCFWDYIILCSLHAINLLATSAAIGTAFSSLSSWRFRGGMLLSVF